MVRFPGSESDIEAATLLAPLMVESIRVAELSVETLRATIRHFTEFDDALLWPTVQAILATRVADDIKAAASLAQRGYFLQAMTLGSSVYELSYTGAYVGTDASRARKWLHWSDAGNPPWPRKKMVRWVLSQTYPNGDSQDDARYASLCWGKHGNPTIQRAGEPAANPIAHVLNVDPSLGNQTHRFGEIALWAMLHSTVTWVARLFQVGALEPDCIECADRLVEAWRPFDARIWVRDD